MHLGTFARPEKADFFNNLAGLICPNEERMDETGLFVVTVASEKGGVGKTTIATNLAVYLKALREDLPVTIASFDNHFSIDNMFAIGGHRGRSVAALFAAAAAGEPAGLGEYGVQFLASERELQAPDDDPQHLHRVLGRSGLSGILILDTRPVLDYFTRNALLAADLVLVPVKDRPSLVNVASLLRVIREGAGDPARVWLLPSLIDARLRLRADIGVREFLTFAARERGYQVIDTWIAKSPKVEGLTTSFSSRIHPVITHARGTVAHRQFRELADFVLQQHQASPAGSRPHSLSGELPPGRRRRLQAECPLCRESTAGKAGHLFQDLRRRRLGLLHRSCLAALLAGTEVPLPEAGGMLVLTFDGAGLAGPDANLCLHLFDALGKRSVDVAVAGDAPPFAPFLQGVTGRSAGEFFRETILVSHGEAIPSGLLEGAGYASFASLRRLVLRELRSG